MKKWPVYLFALYILFSAMVPCSVFDACEDNAGAEHATLPVDKKECSGCSPFSICACAHTVIHAPAISLPEAPALQLTIRYNAFYPDSESDYFNRFFQPPRLS